jgi:hypothetical protein
MTPSARIAIDSDIFFFSLSSSRSDIRPGDVQRLLKHMSSAPKVEIFASLSVIGESTIQCLAGEQKQNVRHDLAELHELIDFWAALDLKFLYPGELVIDACSRLVARYRQGSQKDYRLSDTDLVHLGYALAYDMDYFLTTDRALKHYLPHRSRLNVVDIVGARDLF